MSDTTPQNDDQEDAWQQTWNARESFLTSLLGPTDGKVFHALMPFQLGGSADALCFPSHIPGRIISTCELLGEESQKPNSLGTYELVIADRDNSSWHPNVIARLARYTCDAVLEPHHTMDIDSAVPKGSTISAFLFLEYARATFQSQPAGLLLCIGITPDELAACRKGKTDTVIAALKSANVYPYTDLTRPSTLAPPSNFFSRLFGK